MEGKQGREWASRCCRPRSIEKTGCTQSTPGPGRRRCSWRLRVSEKLLGETARVAQLVEHTLGKGEVTGSIPVASSEGGPDPLMNECESRSRGRGSFGGSLLSKRG